MGVNENEKGQLYFHYRQMQKVFVWLGFFWYYPKPL